MSTFTPTEGTDQDGQIDPKIQARREQVRYEANRKRGRRLIAVSIAAAVFAAGFWVFRSPFLDVDQITVTGVERSGAEAVRAATGIDTGDRLASVPLGRVAERVQDLPWVQSATATRSWPGTLAVRVVERRPVAAVLQGDLRWLLVDESGRQLAIVDDPGDLAQVVRLGLAPFAAEPGRAVPDDFRSLLHLSASMPQRLRPLLSLLRFGEGGEIDGTLVLEGGCEATVRLGRAEQFERKWLALLSVLENADVCRVSQVDVRVPAVPALTPR